MQAIFLKSIVPLKMYKINLENPCFCGLFLFFLTITTPAFAYEFQINVDVCLSEKMILARYSGKSLYPVDTILCSPGKTLIAKKDVQLDQGLYAIIFPEKSKSDFLVARHQKLKIHLKMEESVTAEVKGDPQSEVFSDYTIFMRNMHKKREITVKRYKDNASNTDSILVIRNALNQLNQQVRDYYNENISKFDGEILGSVFSVLNPVDAPNVLSPAEQHYYMKNHFFDHVNFRDQKITNTPFLINQMDVFMNEIVEQVPDSLIKYTTKIIDKSRANDQVFKQVCNLVFSFATHSKIMGMDKLQVAISKRYYLNGLADWTNPEFKNKLQELVDKAEPILIGKTAPEITLLSLNEDDGFISLADVNAKYTLVFFWEPGCYHCKQAIPEIKKIAQQYPASTLSVFAVYTQFDYNEWNDFIFENDLNHWIHVYDKNNQTSVKQVYDVASTPMLYLLDANKKIVAKKFDPKFLKPILTQMLSSN